MNEEILQVLIRKLDKAEPPSGELKRAAVSVILKDRKEPSTLLIKRADREGDPWSGQVAFPGGKAREGDATLTETAIRETQEEVGVDLRKGADFLGYFKSFRTHTGTMDVVPSVFLLSDEVTVRTNEEVSSYRWVELNRLGSAEAKSSRKIVFDGQVIEMPALLVDDYVVWGLTYRIVSSLISGEQA